MNRCSLPILVLSLLLAVATAGCRQAPVEAEWPTEELNAEAGDAKSSLLGSLQGGRLEPGAAALTTGFRGEPLTDRAGDPIVRSGIRLADWRPAERDLDAAGFVRSWNRWLEELGEVETVEIHTWELQLRPTNAGERGLEAVEAIWVLGRLPDGRVREDRLELVLDLVEEAEGWKIAGAGVREGRTAIAPGHAFADVTGLVLPPGYDQTGAQIYTDGGPALADWDDDGDVDLFLPRQHAPAILYANDGEGFFSDVTAASGLRVTALRDASNSALFADWDGDGDLDLAVGSKTHGILLFEQVDRRFRRWGDPLGRPGQWESLAAADADGDGLLDLYACNYDVIDAERQPESYVDARDGQPNAYFVNLGGGRFEERTEEVGMGGGRTRWSYAAAWADFDADSDQDLYVANDYGPNALYVNRGDGTFDERASELGAADFGNGMGVSWGDLDGDLDLDLYVSNMQSFAGNRITALEDFPGTEDQRELYRRFSKGNTLLLQLPDGTFADRSAESGTKGAFWAWGNVAFDYDADADLDLFSCGGFYTGESAADT